MLSKVCLPIGEFVIWSPLGYQRGYKASQQTRAIEEHMETVGDETQTKTIKNIKAINTKHPTNNLFGADLFDQRP